MPPFEPQVTQKKGEFPVIKETVAVYENRKGQLVRETFTETRQPRSVLREWMSYIPVQQQGTILAAMRGPDGMAKDDPSKVLVRRMRACVMVNAVAPSEENTFAQEANYPSIDEMADFFASVDQYPHHWYLHFIHAAEVIGYMHPVTHVSINWLAFYMDAVDDLHLHPETRDEMMARLSGDGPPDGKENW